MALGRGGGFADEVVARGGAEVVRQAVSNGLADELTFTWLQSCSEAVRRYSPMIRPVNWFSSRSGPLRQPRTCGRTQAVGTQGTATCVRNGIRLRNILINSVEVAGVSVALGLSGLWLVDLLSVGGAPIVQARQSSSPCRTENQPSSA